MEEVLAKAIDEAHLIMQTAFAEMGLPMVRVGFMIHNGVDPFMYAEPGDGTDRSQDIAKVLRAMADQLEALETTTSFADVERH